jgi:hypothetical protein
LHGARFVSGEPPWRRGRVTVPEAATGLNLTIDAKRLDAVTVCRAQVKR